MRCQSCGRTNADDAASCQGCGADLRAPAVAQPQMQAQPAAQPSPTLPATPVYAGFWKRFSAWLFDGILVGVIFWGVSAISFFRVFTPSERQNFPTMDPNALMNDPAFIRWASDMQWVFLGFIIGQWLYFAIMESSRAQGTVGKLAMGIRVTDEEGKRISFWRASARYWAKVLSSVTFLVGFVIAAFTMKKQALHDLLAHTFVLNRNP